MGLMVKRRTGERVLIGKDVVVEVVAITASRVELHIAAPADVEIHRADAVGDTCGRLMVGQGDATSDPVCTLTPGHSGRCCSYQRGRAIA